MSKMKGLEQLVEYKDPQRHATTVGNSKSAELKMLLQWQLE
jgi:hypothetical protein